MADRTSRTQPDTATNVSLATSSRWLNIIITAIYLIVSLLLFVAVLVIGIGLPPAFGYSVHFLIGLTPLDTSRQRRKRCPDRVFIHHCLARRPTLAVRLV